MMKVVERIGKSVENGFESLERRLGNDRASIFYLLTSAVFYFFTMVLSRLLANEVNPIQLQYVRGIGTIIFAYIVMALKDIPFNIKEKSIRNQILFRNFIGVIENMSLFFLITKIPLSDINVLQTITPFFVGFFDHLVLKSKYTLKEILLALLSTVGVIFIIKPNMFSPDQQEVPGDSIYVAGAERNFWIISFIIMLIIWSWSVVLVKKLNYLNPLTVNYPYAVFLCVVGGLYQVSTGDSASLDAWFILEMIVFLGGFGFVLHIFFIRALQLGKPGKVSILSNIFVVLGFGFEILYLGEYPAWLKVVGALMVVGSSIKISLDKASS